MRAAIRECERRRCVQKAYNAEHGITPKTVQKAIKDGIEIYAAEQEKAEEIVRFAVRETKEEYEIKGRIEELHKRMIIEAKHLNFEKAAAIRDTIRELEEKLLE
jgi:excinuclease ABC subunit B